MTDFLRGVPYGIRLILLLLRVLGISYKNKVQRVTRYIDSQYVDYVKIMKEYDIGDWEVLRKMLLKEFKKDNRAQIINIMMLWWVGKRSQNARLPGRTRQQQHDLKSLIRSFLCAQEAIERISRGEGDDIFMINIMCALEIQRSIYQLSSFT